MTLPITIHLTEDEALALADLLGWAGDTIEELIIDARRNEKFPGLTPERQAEMDENDKDILEIYEPLADIGLAVSEIIKGTIIQNATMGKPSACPWCGEDNSKAPFLLEQTGSDAHCDHEVDYNYSCDNCGCRFDEVWTYSHKEINRDPKDFSPEEVEKWAPTTTND